MDLDETQRLDRTPLAQMTPQEFAAYAIVVPVEVNPDPASPRRLMVPVEEVGEFERLREEILRCAPNMRNDLTPSGAQDLQSRIIMALMNLEIEGDAACNRLPGGRPMVLVRAEVSSRFGKNMVAETAHRGEVEQAIRRGQSINESSRVYYGFPKSHATQAHA